MLKWALNKQRSCCHRGHELLAHIKFLYVIKKGKKRKRRKSLEKEDMQERLSSTKLFALKKLFFRLSAEYISAPLSFNNSLSMHDV